MLIGAVDSLQPSGAPAREGVAVSGAAASAVAAAPAALATVPAGDQVQDAVAHANAALRQTGHSAVEFEYDPDAETTVVRLVDTQSQQVLRQIPTPEMLEIARAIERMQVILLRSRA